MNGAGMPAQLPIAQWRTALFTGRAVEVERAARQCLREADGAAVMVSQVTLWWHMLALAQWHQLQLDLALVSWRACAQTLLERPDDAPVLLRQKGPEPLDGPLGEATLWRVLAAFTSAGLHGFAHAGSALGLAREGRLLPHDKDLDIALPQPEMRRADACLRAMGWQRVPLGLPWINLASYLWPVPDAQGVEGGLTLDLCGLIPGPGSRRLLGGMSLRGVPSEWNRVLDYPSVPLRRQLSPAGEVWALRDTGDWLDALYGEHWREPDSYFDSAISARNMRGFPLLAQNFAWSRVTATWMRGDWPKAVALVEQALRQCRQHQPQEMAMLQAMALKLDACTKEDAAKPRRHAL